MEKVYLLLRNNHEAGPYTYEELLQQELLPTDLIWVEGESTTWVPPAELKRVPTVSKPTLASLTPEVILSKTPAAAEVPWHLRRRSPEAELEAKALALKAEAEATLSTQKRYTTSATTFKPSKHHPVVFQEEESPLLLEIHRVNKKSVTLPQLIAAGVITALVATGWYNRDKLSLVRPQASMISQAATPVIFQVIPPSVPKPTVVQLVDTVPTATAIVPADTAVAERSIAPVKKQATPTPEVKVAEATAAAPQAEAVAAVEKKEEKPAIVTPPATEKKEEIVKKSDTATTEEVITTAPVKKKGLGEALKKIFKKKKKAEEADAVEE